MIYKFKYWDLENFEIFLKSLNFKNSELNIILNDNLIKFIDNFFDFFSNTKIEFNFIKSDLDIIMVRKLKKYFDENFQIIGKFKFKFVDFDSLEIKSFLEGWKYIYYCHINSIKPNLDLEYEKKETQKVERYKNTFLKYNSFNLCLDFFSKNKSISYFNFPKEENLERFVLYFNIYTEKIRVEIIDLLKKLNINKNIIEILKNVNLSFQFIFAIGFSYLDKNLIRTTLYTRFLEINSNVNYNFIKNFGDFDKIDLTKVKDFAVDYYVNGLEYKFYFKESLFNINLKDKKLNLIFNKKPCIKVLKILRDNSYLFKFEFRFNQFNQNEINILKTYNLYNKSKILSLYIINNKIVKNIFYDV